MAGYTRRSRPDITNGADITAPPLNAEFDQVELAFGTGGHTHDGTAGNAPKIDLATSVTGILAAANGGAGGLNNLTATTDPSITDDSVLGYAPGSLWLNTSSNRIYVCVSATASAAAWYEILLNNTANNILPSGDGVVDLGAIGNRFADLLMAGDATIGGSVTVTAASTFSNNLDVTGDLDVTGSLTVDTNATVTGNTVLNGNTTIGNAATDTVAINAEVSTNIVPATTLIDLGTSTDEFRDLYINGTAHIDTLDVDESATVAANLTVDGVTTLNGNTAIGNANTDTVAVNAKVTTHIVPNTTGARDLGDQSIEFRDLFLDGTAHIDTLDVDESATVAVNLTVGGNAQIDTNLDVDGITTLNGNTTIGDASTDVLYVNSELATSLVPSATNQRDLGTTTKEFRDLYLDGTAHVDTLDVDENATITGTLGVTGNTTLTGTLTTGGITGTTANFSSDVGVTGTSTLATVDINGGAIDGTTIGATSHTTGKFTTLETTGQATLATVNVDGGTIDGATIGATVPSTGAFTTLSASGGLTGDVTGDVTGNVSATTGSSSFNNVTVNGTLTSDLTGNVTAATGSSSFNNVTINGGLDMNAGTTATITNLTSPTNAGDAATKGYVDTADALKLNLTGGTLSGDLTMGGNTVTGLGTPTATSDAATKGYVDQEVSAVIDSAPGALDTLNELAAALGDDANFSTTVTNSIATKLPLAGGTMTGDISLGANKATSTATPATADTLTRKGYVDTQDALKLDLAGGTMSGTLAMGTSKITGMGDPTAAQDAATKTYVDTQDALQVTKSGDSMSGNLAMGTNNITGLATPTANDHATNKSYVDGLFQSTTDAATSAANAATSASNSASSATAAAGSATTASNAATDAETALDSFTDIYLGTFTSAPTTDNDGNALQSGALYFNTTSGSEQLYVYDGSNWQQAAFTLGQAIANIVEDTTPQLGGNLDLNTNNITGTGNINVTGTITSSGAITGDLSGNASTATALQTARSIGLGGDVSGSANFDGTGNITITATVADDSHNHIISNVDGLQTALDAKAPTASPTFTGSITFPTGQTFDGRDVSADGSKLDGISSGAEVNQNAFSNVAVSGQTTVAADGKTDTLTLAAGSNVTITTNASTDTVTITSTDTNTTYSAGTALDLSGTTFNVDLSELSTSTADGDGDYFVVVDTANAQRKLTKGNINISGFNNDAGYTSNVGDITGVTAGTNLTGGGTSGTVTLNMATGGVGAGTYGTTANGTKIDTITVDAYGRVTGVTTGATGDVLGVTAGNGLTGGGTAGTLTLDVGAGTGVTVAADTVSIGQDVATTASPTFGGMTLNGTLTLGANVINDVEDIYLRDKLFHDGDTDTYLWFSSNQVQVNTGGSARFSANTNGFFVESAVKENSTALSGTSVTCNANSAGYFSLTMTGNTTFTFSAQSSGYSAGFVVELTGNGGTVTWPTSVEWAGGTAPDAPASGETDLLVFNTRDGGTTWYGMLAIDAAA